MAQTGHAIGGSSSSDLRSCFVMMRAQLLHPLFRPSRVGDRQARIEGRQRLLQARRAALTLAEPRERGQPHLAVAEIAEWFAIYVYLPKLRDRVVLEDAIRDALAKLDPKFACADGFDGTTGKYVGLFWQKAPIAQMPQSALLVRPEVAVAQLRSAEASRQPQLGPKPADEGAGPVPPTAPGSAPNQQPRRFYGSVEIDMVRPVKAFDAILNAVVMELQRSKGAKARITLEIEADAEEGFSEADIGVIRDNARQLKFKAESTGFE
jgi:hypothetical protein